MKTYVTIPGLMLRDENPIYIKVQAPEDIDPKAIRLDDRVSGLSRTIASMENRASINRDLKSAFAEAGIDLSMSTIEMNRPHEIAGYRAAVLCWPRSDATGRPRRKPFQSLPNWAINSIAFAARKLRSVWDFVSGDSGLGASERRMFVGFGGGLSDSGEIRERAVNARGMI